MAVYLGVDLHVGTQTVCWCDTADGEIHQRVLNHEQDDIRSFYAQFDAPIVIGLEATGYALWFHPLVEELGHQVLVGDAYAIRQFARRRQKNDRRDAELLLDLLLHGDFPAVHVPPAASQEVISLLRYRHRLVRMRTMLKNSLQAIALSHRVRIGPRLFSVRGRQQLEALPLAGAQALQRKQCTEMILALTERIEDAERELAGRAEQGRRVERLRTHPGGGILTALAFVQRRERITFL